MSSPAHLHDLTGLAHDHHFAAAGSSERASAMWQVACITLAAMVLELAMGYWSGSLALTADGWHMGTHALALGGAALAITLSRRAANSQRFAFGGWKIEMLAAYSSALLLLAVALSLVLQAIDALRQPRAIAYEEAIAVALLGLGVNLLCAWLLSRRAGPGGAQAAQARSHDNDVDHHRRHDRDHGQAHDHGHSRAHAHAQDRGHATGQSHGHTHGHAHGHAHADANFRAAWLHVVADAVTSVLALVALAGGLWWGWGWLDPAVALVGAVIIARWGIGVGFEAARALIDASRDTQLAQQVRETLESDGDAKVADLHVWQVGAQAFAAAITVVADTPLPPAAYRERLRGLRPLRHVTLEVHRCARPASPGPGPGPGPSPSTSPSPGPGPSAARQHAAGAQR